MLVRKKFPARASALSDIRSFIRDRAKETAIYPGRAEDLVLAVDEACANSVIHSRSPAIEIVWRALRDGAEVEVRDDGVFGTTGDPEGLPLRRGFGIPIMHSVVDEVDIHVGTASSPGTSVRFVIRESPLPGGSAASQ